MELSRSLRTPQSFTRPAGDCMGKSSSCLPRWKYQHNISELLVLMRLRDTKVALLIPAFLSLPLNKDAGSMHKQLALTFGCYAQP